MQLTAKQDKSRFELYAYNYTIKFVLFQKPIILCYYYYEQSEIYTQDQLQ